MREVERGRLALSWQDEGAPGPGRLLVEGENWKWFRDAEGETEDHPGLGRDRFQLPILFKRDSTKTFCSWVRLCLLQPKESSVDTPATHPGCESVGSSTEQYKKLTYDFSRIDDTTGVGRGIFFFFSFIFISWRLITLQYCSRFYHTLTWISQGGGSLKEEKWKL